MRCLTAALSADKQHRVTNTQQSNLSNLPVKLRVHSIMSSKVRWRTPFNHRWHHESRCCNVSHCLLVCSTRFLNTFQIKCFTVNTVKGTHWSDTMLTGLIKWITVIRTTGLHCCGPAEVHPVMVTAFPEDVVLARPTMPEIWRLDTFSSHVLRVIPGTEGGCTGGASPSSLSVTPSQTVPHWFVFTLLV